MVILTKKTLCDKWLLDKTINPQTLRKIKENGPVFKELEKKCALNQKKNIKLNQKEICDKWHKNKTINPQTLRKIKKNGPVFKELEKKCSLKSSDKSFKSFKSEPKSSDKSFKSFKSEEIISSNTKKIAAVKKIHKLFIPYIKRTSINIIDRINYYLIIKKYLLSIKETKNCVRLYNIDEKTNKPIYRVGNKIILDKQIGSLSAYGIAFLSHFKSNNKKGTTFDKLNKFAVKITNQGKDNKKEIKILEDLTKLVIDFKCPHFPISYGSLRCNNARVKSENPDDYSIVKDKHKVKKLFPNLINKNKSLLIQINELASGDLKNFLKSNNNNDKLNVLTQLLLSIMFFHNYTNSYHCDTHTGNFLYHKINPGGYLHYNLYGKDYYLENQGHLWVIWDFGIVQPFLENNNYGPANKNISVNYDFSIILDRLHLYENSITPNEFAIIELLEKLIRTYNVYTDPKYLKNIHKEILIILSKNVSSFTTIKPSNIINKKPYIIGEENQDKRSPPKVKPTVLTRLFSIFK
jgi:hypothetical protein